MCSGMCNAQTVKNYDYKQVCSNKGRIALNPGQKVVSGRLRFGTFAALKLNARFK